MAESDTPAKKTRHAGAKVLIALLLFAVAGVITWRQKQSNQLPDYSAMNVEMSDDDPSADRIGQRQGNRMGQRMGQRQGPGGGPRRMPGAGPGAGGMAGDGAGRVAAIRVASLHDGRPIMPFPRPNGPFPFGAGDDADAIATETLTPTDRIWTGMNGRRVAGRLIAVRDDYVLIERYHRPYYVPRADLGPADLPLLATWDSRIAAFRAAVAQDDQNAHRDVALQLTADPVLTASCVDAVMALTHDDYIHQAPFEAYRALAAAPDLVFTPDQLIAFEVDYRRTPVGRRIFWDNVPTRTQARVDLHRLSGHLAAFKLKETDRDADQVRLALITLRGIEQQVALCDFLAASPTLEDAPAYPILLSNSQAAPPWAWSAYQRAIRVTGQQAEFQATLDATEMSRELSRRNMPRRLARQRNIPVTGFFESHGLDPTIAERINWLRSAAKDRKWDDVLEHVHHIWRNAPELRGMFWDDAQAAHLALARTARDAGDDAAATEHIRRASACGPMPADRAYALAQALIDRGELETAWILAISHADLDAPSAALMQWMTDLQQRVETSGPYPSQQAWIEQSLSAGIVDLLRAVGGRATDPPASATLRLTGATPTATGRRELHLTLPERDEPVVVAAPDYPHHIWSAGDWQPAVAALARQLQITAPPTAKPPLDVARGSALLGALVDLDPRAIAQADLDLGAWLADAPADPQRQEAAAFLVMVLASRETMPDYADPRAYYTQAAAHLAVAQWLNGGAYASPLGTLADAILEQRLGRMVDGQARLAATPALWPAAEAPWRQMLALEASRDPRPVQPLADQPAIIRIAAFRALLQQHDELNNMEATIIDVATQPANRAQPEIVHLLIGGGHYSVGLGNALALPQPQLTQMEWATIRPLYTGAPPTIQDLEQDVGRRPDRPVPAVKRGGPPAILGWDSWCAHYDRRLHWALLQSHSHYRIKLGLPNTADQLRAEFTARMSASPIFAPTLTYMTPRDPTRLDQELAVYRREMAGHPQDLPPGFWDDYQWLLDTATRDYGLLSLPGSTSTRLNYVHTFNKHQLPELDMTQGPTDRPAAFTWLGYQPLPGTRYGVFAVGRDRNYMRPDYIDDPTWRFGDIALAAFDQDPRHIPVITYLFENKYRLPDDIPERLKRATQPMVPFSVWAQKWDAMLYNPPPQEKERSEDEIWQEACAENPAVYLNYGLYLWGKGRHQDAAAAWRAYRTQVTDAVEVANHATRYAYLLYRSSDPDLHAEGIAVARHAAAVGSYGGMHLYMNIQILEKNYHAAFDLAQAMARRYGKLGPTRFVAATAATHGDPSYIDRYAAFLARIRQNPDQIHPDLKNYFEPDYAITQGGMQRFDRMDGIYLHCLHVARDTPATQAIGLRQGDLLLAINNLAVHDMLDFHYLATLNVDSIQITVKRDDELFTYGAPAIDPAVAQDLEAWVLDHAADSSSADLAAWEYRQLTPPTEDSPDYSPTLHRYFMEPQPGARYIYGLQKDTQQTTYQAIRVDLENPGLPEHVGPPFEGPFHERPQVAMPVGDALYMLCQMGAKPTIIAKLTADGITRWQSGDQELLTHHLSTACELDGKIYLTAIDKNGCDGGLIELDPATDTFRRVFDATAAGLTPRQQAASTYSASQMLPLRDRHQILFTTANRILVGRTRIDTTHWLYTPATGEAKKVASDPTFNALYRLDAQGIPIVNRRHGYYRWDVDGTELVPLYSTFDGERDGFPLHLRTRERQVILLGDHAIGSYGGLILIQEKDSQKLTALRHSPAGAPLRDTWTVMRHGPTALFQNSAQGALIQIRLKPDPATTSPGWVSCDHPPNPPQPNAE